MTVEERKEELKKDQYLIYNNKDKDDYIMNAEDYWSYAISENYTKAELINRINNFSIKKDFIKAFNTGFNEGRRAEERLHGWHDCDANPKDVPEERKLVVVKTFDGGTYISYYKDKAWWFTPVQYSPVIKWKEIE